MIKKFKTLILTTIFSVTSFALPLVPATVAVAQNNTEQGLCEGSQLTLGADCTGGVAAGEAQNNVNKLVTDAINLFSFIIGIISVIMIMVGGIKYITSQGSSDSVSSAKNTILYAVVGLVIVALAQVIVRFVLGSAQSVDNALLQLV